jgi:hypothetical protein
LNIHVTFEAVRVFEAPTDEQPVHCLRHFSNDVATGGEPVPKYSFVQALQAGQIKEGRK